MRCVNPNTKKRAGEVEGLALLHQLRCSGLMDAVRVTRAGFPSRMPHDKFSGRFGCLGQWGPSQQGALSASFLVEQLINQLALPPQTIVLGATKVFLKAHGMDALEKARTCLVSGAACKIQTYSRRAAASAMLAQVRKACALIQRSARGHYARVHTRRLREWRAAVRLQKISRAFAARRLTAQLLRDASRLAARLLREACAAIRIAASWRRRACVSQRVRALVAVTALQCLARCRSAKMNARGRRTALRDAGLMREEAGKLRDENNELKRLLQQAQEEREHERCRADETAAAVAGNSEISIPVQLHTNTTP